MFRILTTALAALIVTTPLAAFSQEVPSYALSAQGGPADEQIRGRITSFDGAYALTVSDERGFVDNVDLHDGTIINPTGLTLAPGMVVSILGYNDGPAFSANEIDTPYSYDSGVPYYAGHRWDYYGPSISLGFFFGNVGWWHGNDFRGGYSYIGGARSYHDVRISNVVRNDYSDRNVERNDFSARNVERNDYSARNGESFRNSGGVSAAAPERAQVTQQRSYEAPRSFDRPSVARQPAARDDGPRGDGGHDHGGRPH
jgi:hypothetical protein